MGGGLTFEYDAVGDILYVNLVPPYKEQESDMIAEMVVARTNPNTGRVENLEILSFMRTLQSGERLELPVDSNLMPQWAEIESWSPPLKPKIGRRAAS